jgi:N-acetyl-anhydromuramyl-L-alanine amidase AmpD
MTTSPDHPDLPFVEAKYYAAGRGGRRVLWVVIHDMEAGESRARAENTAEYFRTMSDGRFVSSHYTADVDSIVQCVPLKDTAFCVGNTPGNSQGIQWELSGFASQTRAQWLDEFGMGMFRRVAPYIRADAERFGIPLRRCTVADLKAFRPGVTSHNDLRLAFGGTTHTDPGPNFPWDVFMDIITGGEAEDMTPEQSNALTDCLNILTGMASGASLVDVHDRDGKLNLAPLYRRVAVEVAALNDLDPDELDEVKAAAREGAVSGQGDLIAAVVAALPPGSSLTRGDVEDALKTVLRAGIGD